MKLLLSLFIFLLSLNTQAIDIKIFYAKGDVKIVDLEGVKKKALRGETAIEGDKIVTGDKSFVIIKIDKHSVHRVEENSSLLISKLPYFFKDSEHLEQGGSFYLEIGTIFSEVFKKSGNESLEVRTKNTIMGVRGTKLMVSRDLDSNHTWLSVDEGEVEIKNEISNHHDIVLKKQSIVVENDSHFTKQKRFDWHNKVSWNIDKGLDEVKTFKVNSKLAFMEHAKKRTKWTRNEVQFRDGKNNWNARKKSWSMKVKVLKPNLKLKKRTKSLDRKLKKLIKKRGMPKSTIELYKGIENSKDELKLNDFVNKKIDRSMDKVRNKKRRMEMLNKQQRRRDRPRIKPVVKPTSSPISTKAPTTSGTN
jgi:hypothetical protein